LDQDGDGDTDLQYLIKMVSGGGAGVILDKVKACLIKVDDFFDVSLTGTLFFQRHIIKCFVKVKSDLLFKGLQIALDRDKIKADN